MSHELQPQESEDSYPVVDAPQVRRRAFLGLLGLGAAASAAGCGSWPGVEPGGDDFAPDQLQPPGQADNARNENDPQTRQAELNRQATRVAETVDPLAYDVITRLRHAYRTREADDTFWSESTADGGVSMAARVNHAVWRVDWRPADNNLTVDLTDTVQADVGDGKQPVWRTAHNSIAVTYRTPSLGEDASIDEVFRDDRTVLETVQTRRLAGVRDGTIAVEETRINVLRPGGDWQAEPDNITVEGPPLRLPVGDGSSQRSLTLQEQVSDALRRINTTADELGLEPRAVN